MSEPAFPPLHPDAQWSVEVRDADDDVVLASYGADTVLPTASIGKLVLLVEAAHRLAAGTLDPAELLVRTDEDAVADSGLWHVLRSDELPVADACALVGAVSDNFATNVLLRRLGLDAVTATATRIDMARSRLLDRVRDDRGPEHAPALSVGCAEDLARFCARLHRREILSPAVSETVSAWLSLNTDLSMVGGAFGLDPLAHAGPDRGLVLWNKTGTTETVRGDVGVVSGPRRTLAYAVLASWEESPDPSADPRDRILDDMREVGRWLRQQVGAQ